MLALYAVSAVGSAQGTAYLQLQKLCEHTLEHTAANMVCGSFGGVRGEFSTVSGLLVLRCVMLRGSAAASR